MTATARPELLHTLGLQGTADRLRDGDGLRLAMGPFVFALRSPLADVALAIWKLYGQYPLASDDDFVDFHVQVRRPWGWRRWWKPQVVFELDGVDPFNPLPGDQGFPLLEWGLNWCVYALCHQYLIVHAAVLERGGRALVLPAPSGSGKSTLCAALLFEGWRLLSDELALWSPRHRHLVPLPRPVSLKNASIDILSSRVPTVEFGSRVTETSKGVVAHFAAPADAVAHSQRPALPGWVVLPRYTPGSPTLLTPLPKAETVVSLAQNAFNYDLFGAEGFEILCDWADRSQGHRFEYSSLDEAMAVFDRLSTEGGAA